MTLRASLMLCALSLAIGVWLGLQPARDVDREVAVRTAECRANLADAQRGQASIHLESADRIMRCMHERVEDSEACGQLLHKIVAQSNACARFLTIEADPVATRRAR